jgi:hypothetical protein
VENESGGDAAEVQFTAVTTEGAAERRFTALFDHAQAHAGDLMAWWEVNRAEYVRDYDHLSADEQRLVDVLEQIRSRK